MLRRFSIKTRLIAMAALGLVLALGVAAAFTENALRIQRFSVNEAQALMFEGQRQKLETATRAAASMLGELLAETPDKDARLALIRKAVEAFRFEEDKSGYFFVYQGTVNAALPTKKELQGKDLSGAADKNGVRYVQKLAEAAASGGGFVEYVFDKPGAGSQPKLSFAAPIPGTDYWIGTGVYLDNVAVKRAQIDQSISDMVSSSNLWIFGVLIVLVIVVVLPLAILLVRSVTVPLAQATNAAQSISNGAYEVNLDASARDEAAVLARALNEMAATLRENMLRIAAKTKEAEEQAQTAKAAAEEAHAARAEAERAKRQGMMDAAHRLEAVVAGVSGASEEINAHCEEISQGAAVQDERIQATAAAMEEMNATVLEVAKNAGAAAMRGEEVKNNAREGQTVADQSIEAMRNMRRETEALQESMNALGERVQSIGRIMAVITDIADQTNLLALNAAIEAARAGEAGRGFAVVADEVRKLAEKTMSATKEVGDSVRGIQEVTARNVEAMRAVTGGLEQAAEFSGRSGETLERIVKGAEESAGEIRSIATAAEEQSASSEEINASIDEINRITRDTVEGVGRTVEAARELSGQLADLEGLIRELKQG